MGAQRTGGTSNGLQSQPEELGPGSSWSNDHTGGTGAEGDHSEEWLVDSAPLKLESGSEGEQSKEKGLVDVSLSPSSSIASVASGSSSADAAVGADDVGWCWMIVLGAWLVSFLLAGFTLSFTIVYQELRQRYGQSASRTAWVLATYGAVRMFSSPMVSALCNAYSHRQVSFIGGVINAVAMMLSGYVPSLNWLYVIFGVVGGFSSNMVYLPPFPVIGYYFKRRRGLAMALASTGSGLGGVVMAPLIEALFRTYGYSGGMLIIGGLMLNCCVASALLRPVTVTTTVTVTHAKSPLKVSPRASQTLATNQKGHQMLTTQLAWYYGSAASFGSFMALDKEHFANGYSGCSGGTNTSPRSKCRYLPMEGTGVVHSSRSHLDEASLEVNQKTTDSSRQQNGIGQPHKTSEEDTATNKDGGRAPHGGVGPVVGRLKGALSRAARVASERMDLGLLAQPDFLLYCLMMLGYYTCFTTTNTFISGIALNIGFTEAQVALMLTASYALDTPSRLISGALFDVHALRHLHVPIMTGLGIVASLTAMFLPLPTSIPGLFVLWAAYQFIFNGNQAQQVPLTVEIVGVQKAMSACGLARVFMGVGEVIGPTMGGAIKDRTGSYNLAFYIGGSAFILGCLIFQTYDTIRRINNKRTADVLTDNTQQKTFVTA